MVAALLVHLVGTGNLCSADDKPSGEATGSRERNDFTWLTDDPAFRPNLAPAIWHVLAWQGIGFGVMLSMDSEETGLKRPDFENFRNAFEHGPVWDNDEWTVNYIAHPLWGSETYLRARGQGFGRLSSFLFSSACGVVWEFCIESWSERPSINDLLLTSTVGSLIGEWRFHVKRKLALDNSKTAKVLDFVIDPFHGIDLHPLAGQNSV